MDFGQILQTAGQPTVMGVFVGYLIWAEQRRDKQRAAARAAELEERKAERIERNDIDKARTAADVDLARSLTMLSMVIQGKPNV